MQPTRPTGTGYVSGQPARPPEHADDPVAAARPPRRPSRRIMLAAGAALVALLGARTIVVTTFDSGTPTPAAADPRTPEAPAPATAGVRATTADATSSPTPAGQSLPRAYPVPGSRPTLPWPKSGQASIDVQGVGTVGSSGRKTPVPIASVTKVMTAYLILRDHPLGATDSGPVITVSAAEAAAYPHEQADGQSLVPVTAGERLTERQALQALMLPSADNIARILARWDASSIGAFLTRMNSTAAALGMHHTHYTDPSGLAASTTSTAADQVKLGTQAMKILAFRQIVRMPTATIPVAGLVKNYNKLLGQDGVIGIKTGSTSAAGGCLLFAATHQIDGHTVTIVGAVFGQHGSVLNGLPQALSASQRLIRATAAALDTYPVVRAGQTFTTGSESPPLVAGKDLTVIGWPGLTYTIEADGGDAIAAVSPAGTSTTVPTR